MLIRYNKEFWRKFDNCDIVSIDVTSDTERNLTEEELIESGFFKIPHDGGGFVTGRFYNPITKETFTETLRDYDYADCSRDNDSLYFMKVNETVRKKYFHEQGSFFEGDYVEVFKGRKMPIGYIGKVERFYDWKDQYGRTRTTYVVFEDGQKTNYWNCRLYKAVD